MLISFFEFYATFIAVVFLSILTLFQLMWISKFFIPILVLPTSIIISMIIAYLITKDKPRFFKNLLITMGLCLFAGFIAYYSFDKAGDGRWYHQPIIILLKSGWNPIYDFLKNDYLFDFLKNSNKVTYINVVNHTYAKGNEILAFAFIAFFKHIQVGKIINILFASYCFAISYLVLNKVFNLKHKHNIFICLYITFNPIFFSQYLSFYLDANLFVCYTILLFSILLYFHQMLLVKKSSSFSILHIFTSSILLINLKFTGLVYAFILLFAFEFTKIIFEYKVLKISSWNILKKNMILGIIFLSILLIFSIHPYLENLYLSRHIFWPLLGNDIPEVFKFDITSWSPYNKFITFLLAYFLPYPPTYPDFSFTPSIRGVVSADYAFFVLGPFFGLIFLVSLFCCFRYCYQNIKKANTDFAFFAIFFSLVIVILSIIINPSFRYIRYVPQVMLIPAITLIILFKYDYKWFSGKVIKLFIVMSIINSGIFFMGATSLTAYRTYKFMQMEHFCLHEQCILEIQNHNPFEISLPNELTEDGVKIMHGSCLNQHVIWQDALGYGNNNIICTSQ